MGLPALAFVLFVYLFICPWSTRVVSSLQGRSTLLFSSLNAPLCLFYFSFSPSPHLRSHLHVCKVESTLENDILFVYHANACPQKSKLSRDSTSTTPWSRQSMIDDRPFCFSGDLCLLSFVFLSSSYTHPTCFRRLFIHTGARFFFVLFIGLLFINKSIDPINNLIYRFSDVLAGCPSLSLVVSFLFAHSDGNRLENESSLDSPVCVCVINFVCIRIHVFTFDLLYHHSFVVSGVLMCAV